MSENFRKTTGLRDYWIPVFKPGSLRLPIETHDSESNHGLTPRWTARVGRLEARAPSKKAALEKLSQAVMEEIRPYPRDDRFLTLRGPAGDVYTAARLEPGRVEMSRSLPGEMRPTTHSEEASSRMSLRDHICETFSHGFILTGLFQALSQLARGRFSHLCPECNSVSDLERPGPGEMVTCWNPCCRHQSRPRNWYRRNFAE